MEKITAFLVEDQIVSNSAEAQELFKKSRFGEKAGQKILYSQYEAFYLINEGKMKIFDLKNKEIPTEKLLKKFTKNKKFHTNYFVFKDLRSKGYTVKTALKFGAEFRVYDKGKNIGKDHSKWICFPVQENKTTTWHDFSAKNRVAHSTKKNLLIAIVDDEGDVSYFEISWKKV